MEREFDDERSEPGGHTRQEAMRTADSCAREDDHSKSARQFDQETYAFVNRVFWWAFNDSEGKEV